MGSEFPADPELSISYTQMRSFDSCARQWWIGAVGHWNGWSEGEATPAGIAYRLKKLEPASAWVGKVVHRAIAVLLRDATVPVARVCASLSTEMRRQFEHSAAIGRGRFGIPKEFRLAEHYFGADLDESFLEESVAEMENLVGSFERYCQDNPDLNFRELADSARKARRFLRIDDEKMPFSERKFTSPRIADALVSVYASPDFVVELASGGVLVIDWKTGAPKDRDISELSPQLRGYLAWVHLASGLDHSHDSPVELFEFFLPEGREVGRIASRADVAGAIAELDRRGTELVALKGQHARVPMEACPPSTKVARCSACTFRSVCKAGHEVLHAAGG